MRYSLRRIPLVLIALGGLIVGSPSIGHADLINITSTDGNANFQWNPDVGGNGTSLLSASWDGNYAPAFIPMLRYRRPSTPDPNGGGMTTLTMSDSGGLDVVTNSVTNNGRVGTQHVDFSYVDGFGTVDMFDVDFNFVLGEDNLGNSLLRYSITIENVSGGNITDVDLFSYYDWDLRDNQNTGEDAFINEFEGFTQRVNAGQGDPSVRFAFHGTDNLENWEVATWDSLRVKILGGGDLSNSGTPFATGDMTAAFGWDLGTMADGESFTVNFLVTSVPEPSMTVALIIGCLGLGGIQLARRRKRA